MVYSKYCGKSKILSVELRGNIEINEMFQFIDVLIEKSISNTHLLILEESNNAGFNFFIEDISKIINCLRQKIGDSCRVRHAMVRSCPKGTALGILHGNINNIENYSVDVFSTRNGAMNWLLK